MKKAILFGASGFIGSCLLIDLLNNTDYDQVSIVVRKTLELNHPKLIELIADYSTLDRLKDKIEGDEIFIALGTTQKNTPDRNEYYQIDHDYPVKAAMIARGNGARSVFIVTAVGADANSTIFYIKTKGEIERDILSLNFKHTCIFRPSLIMGERKENRTFERTLIKIWGYINPILIGKSLNKYRGMTGQDIARAMMNAAKEEEVAVRILEWQEMTDLLV